MTLVKLNTTKITKAARSAFREACFLQGRVFTEVISEPGAFSSHPNSDIVDTGALRASQTLTFEDADTARFAWPVEYSLYVQKGYTRSNGTIIEGRDWIAEGQRRFNVADAVAKLMKTRLK